MALRFPPIASSSSMKMIAGCFFRAAAKSSRIRLAPGTDGYFLFPSRVFSDTRAYQHQRRFRRIQILKQRRTARGQSMVSRYEKVREHTTPASPATALANIVLPVPGGPVKSTPLGSLPPNAEKLVGSFKNSMISFNSSLASSTP